MVYNGTDVASNGQRNLTRQVGSGFCARCWYAFCSISAMALVAERYVGSTVDSIVGTQTIDQAFPAEADWGPSDIAGVEAGELNLSKTKPAPTTDTHEAGFHGHPADIGEDEGGRGPYEQVAGHPTGRRIDTLMLFYLRAIRRQIYAMSVMRDLWKDSLGQGRRKISAGLASGGVPLVVQGIGALFNQPFDHIAIIGTDDFVDLADPLGGVEPDVLDTFKSYHKLECALRAKMQVLDGGAVLAFVREAFQDKGYQQVSDQQMDLHSVLSTLPSKYALPDPLSARRLIKEFVLYLAEDVNFPASIVVELALRLRSIRGNDVHVVSLLSDVTRASGVGLLIVLIQQSAMAGISHAQDAGGTRWIPPRRRTGTHLAGFFNYCQPIYSAMGCTSHVGKAL